MQNNYRSQKSIAVWCITPNGYALGKNLNKKMDSATLFASETLGHDVNKGHTLFFKKLSLEIEKQFNSFDGHIFFFSVGIAVRIIAPLLNSKLSDPAVVVVDDRGTFAVSLISGHIGGANELALFIAGLIGATPVITTATDINQLPAIDTIASKANFHIETPENIKRVNMAILKNEALTIYDPIDRIKPLLKENYPSLNSADKQLSADISCAYDIQPVSRGTLILRPPVLCVGIGCNRGTTFEKIYDFFLSVFRKNNLSIHSISSIGTSDVKADEKGLIAFAEKLKIPLQFFSKNELNSIEDIPNPSGMAEKYLGVKSVSEAAAILSAGGGRLLIEKQKNEDVTVAVAIIK